MKFCSHCGTQIADEAVVCPSCGCAAGAPEKNKESTFKTLAKIFMVIGCICSAGAFLIPLCWTIPMTVSYWRAVQNRKPVGTGFKVCALIFVSLLAGIFMLCDNED